MMLKTQIPVTVLFRGNLRDTAVLIGLVQSRVPIGIIAYTGPIEKTQMDQLRSVNSWLEAKGQPVALIHPYLTYEQLERIPVNPLIEWGWSLEECKAAITMAGLPVIELNN